MEKINSKKNITKYKILNYILNRKEVSKVELAKQLNLSMPTVLTNVSELISKGVITEVGELESTGGRKARSLGIKKDFRYSLGVDITARHIGMVLIDLSGEIVKQERIQENFTADVSYCSVLAETVRSFYKNEVPEEKILGIGISLPGIINQKDKVLVKSHALHLDNFSLKMMEQLLPFSVYFENDANAAMLAENPRLLDNAVYLSLNHTLGGAICMDGKLFTGQHQKAGEFGHMILKPEGKQCYCGKKGCADAYCAGSVLLQNGAENLDTFMSQLGTDQERDAVWQQYLDNLAILISNIRMFFDTDIILGGAVGGYLSSHMIPLSEKVFRYNLFDGDVSYLKNCSYQKEASAVGVAKYFFETLIDQV